MKNRMAKRTIFTRIILVFLVGIIPIYVLGIITISQGEITIVNRYKESVQTQMQIYFAELEKDLGRIKSMQNSLIYSESLNKLKMKDIESFSFDNTQEVRKVSEQLMTVKLCSDNIESIIAYIPSLQRAVVAKGGKVRYEEFSHDLYPSDITAYALSGDLFYQEGNYYMMAKPAHTPNFNVVNSFSVEIKLSKENVESVVRQYNALPDAVGYILFEEFGSAIGAQQDAEFLSAAWEVEQSGKAEERIFVKGKRYIPVLCRSQQLAASYVQFIPEAEALAPISRFRIPGTLFSVAAALAILLYALSCYKMVKKPMQVLTTAFRTMEQGALDKRITVEGRAEFSYVYQAFNQMADRIQNLIETVYVQKNLNTKAKLRQLQAQINPHFLYNSLFILRNRIKKEKYDSAEKLCEMLGKYFMYLNKNYQDTTDLKDEVNHAKLYAEIQSIRFSPRITVRFEELPENWETSKVPRLILQPIIENAFKYSLEQRESEGVLQVDFIQKGRGLLITVEDNGINREKTLSDLEVMGRKLETNAEEPSGLGNIDQRLRLFATENSGLSFDESPLGGVRVSMYMEKSSREGGAEDEGFDRR